MHTALIYQPDPIQCTLWESSLQSQNISVISKDLDPDWISEQARQLSPDLLVVDLAKLDTDHLAFCHILHNQLPNVPLVFTQPEVDDSVQSLLIKWGAFNVIPYLEKDPYKVISTFIPLFQRLQWFDTFSARKMNEALESIKGYVESLEAATSVYRGLSTVTPAETAHKVISLESSPSSAQVYRGVSLEHVSTQRKTVSPRYYRGCKVG